MNFAAHLLPPDGTGKVTQLKKVAEHTKVYPTVYPRIPEYTQIPYTHPFFGTPLQPNAYTAYRIPKRIPKHAGILFVEVLAVAELLKKRSSSISSSSR